MNLELPPRIRKYIHFTTSEDMKEVDSDSVQSIITSPPYWNLKDYKHPEQIGHGETYERYHERLDKVWTECKRVLKPDGTLWIVVDKMMWNREILHIPYHIARHCREIGFYFKELVVWNKPTAIAGMSKKNLVNKYEHVLFFTKSKSDFKLRKLQNEQRMTPDITGDGQLTDLWRFPVKAGSIRWTPPHEAPFPEELIRRIALISTEEGDLVLDPFLGSGTTMKVALELNRRCIGYEINKEFIPMIAERLNNLKVLALQSRLPDF